MKVHLIARTVAIVLMFLSLTCSADENWLKLIEQARSYAQVKDFKAAELHAREALDSIEKDGDKSRGRLAFTYLMLGEISQNQGLSREAEPFYRQAYELGRKMEAENESLPFSPDSVCASLGTTLRENQKLDEAESLLKSCIKPQKKVLNREDLNVLSTLIYTLLQQRKFTEAESVANTSLETLRSNNHQESLEVSLMMQMLAKSIQRQEKGNRWGEAAGIMRDALRICQNVAPGNDLNCANIEVDYAEAIAAQGEFEKAEPYATHAYQARKTLLGDEHPYTASAAMLLGELQFYQGHYENALPTLKYVHANFKKVYGAKNSYMVSIHHLLVTCYRKLGMESEAGKLERDTGLWVIKGR